MEKNEKPFASYLLDLLVKVVLIMLMFTAAMAINTYVTRDVGKYVVYGTAGYILDTSTGVIKRPLVDERPD